MNLSPLIQPIKCLFFIIYHLTLQQLPQPNPCAAEFFIHLKLELLTQ